MHLLRHSTAVRLELFNRLERCKELISTLRRSREGGSPVEFAMFNCMPLDSGLRGNDEKYDGMAFNYSNCSILHAIIVIVIPALVEVTKSKD